MIWTCSVADMKTRNTKEFFVHPYKKTNIGRRTGKDIRAGKNIRKDADGYEIFEDYFSESDVDLTLNQTAVKLSNLTTTKENIENEAHIVEENEKDVNEPSKLSSVSHIPVPCQKTSINTNNKKDIKDVNPVAWIKNKQIGRRTGRNIKAGKIIRKDKDGYEIFEDYWSESEADSSVFSKSSHSTLHSERNKSLRKPFETKRPLKGSTFREEENPVAWIKNKNIGRRTGRNIKAGKNIGRDSFGYEKFEDYFSESEVDSLMESRINESSLEKSRLSRKSVHIDGHAQQPSEDVRIVTDSVNNDTSKHRSRHVAENSSVKHSDHTRSHLNADFSPDKNSVIDNKNSQDTLEEHTDTTQSSVLSEENTDIQGSQNSAFSEDGTDMQGNQNTTLSKDGIDTQGSRNTNLSDDVTDTQDSQNTNLSEDGTVTQSSQDTTLSDDGTDTQGSQDKVLSDTDKTNQKKSEECVNSCTQHTVVSGTNGECSHNINSTHVNQNTFASEDNETTHTNHHLESDKKSDNDNTQGSQSKTTLENDPKELSVSIEKSKQTAQNRLINQTSITSNRQSDKILPSPDNSYRQSSEEITLSNSKNDFQNNTERTRTKTTSKTRKSKSKTGNSGDSTVLDKSMSTDALMLEERTNASNVNIGENVTSAGNMPDTSCNTSRTQKRKVTKTKKSTGKSKNSGNVTITDGSKTETLLEEKTGISTIETNDNICDQSEGESSQKTGTSKTRNTSRNAKERQKVAVAKKGETTHDHNHTGNSQKTRSAKTRKRGNKDLSRLDKTDISLSHKIENNRERGEIVNDGHASELHVTEIQKSVINDDTPHLSWKAPAHQIDGPTINIGGSITGSITRCEDKTLHVTGVTPAISFRTRKRLSYSVAEVDETVHVMKPGRRSDPTSDYSVREDRELGEQVKKPKRSILTKSLMMKTLQLDSDSDASIGFLSLAGPSNKVDDEDIVIVDTRNETKSKLPEKSRLSMKPGEQLEKSEVVKPTKTDRRKSRKKSGVTDNVENENVDIDSKLKTKPSKLKEEFEKEFDIISLESDESVLQNVSKTRKKGEKDKNDKGRKNKKSISKRIDEENKEKENVIVENKTKQKKNKKVKGKNEKEKANMDMQDIYNESDKHVFESENHLDSTEPLLNNIENCVNGSLTKLQKNKLARKKSFMFDESELESIAGVSTPRNTEQYETEEQNNDNFKGSRVNSVDADENLQNKTAPIQTKSRRGKRKISVPLSLPRRRQQQKLSTPKSLPPRKRKISQSKTRKSAIQELNNDKDDGIEHLQKSRKMSVGERIGKDEADKSQVIDKKANLDGKKASKRSKKQESGKDEKSTVDENLDISLEKKSKKAKASIAETPVSIRSQNGESPLPFEVSNIEQAFQSGVSFRHRSRISELNDSLQPHPLASPGDADVVDIGIAAKIKESELLKTMEDSQTLTPCIVKPGNNRKSKGRRVTINNLTTQHTFIADVSGSSSDNRTVDETVNNNDISVNSISSTPPVHFFEVTNTETPAPVLTVVKKQIIFPSPAPDGLRRSKRNRVKPLEWHKNERIIYDRRKSGLVICGVEPSAVECKILQQEAKRKEKMKKRKGKGKTRQRMFSPARNLSMHVDIPTDMNVTVSSEIPVFNPESNEEVLLECVGTKDMNVFVGPTGEEPKESDPFLMSRLIDHRGVGNGFLLIRPKQDKPEQLLLRGSLMFILLRGKISVKINRAACIFEAEDTFLVPQGNKYSIKNLRSDQDAKLFYTVIKDVEKYSSSEEDGGE